MNRKKIIIITCFIIVILLLFVFMIINLNNISGDSDEVDQYICSLVEQYITENYHVDCKVKTADLTHNDFGITGGLYMYEFKCITGNGTEFVVTYTSYTDLNEESIEQIKIQNLVEEK